MKFIKQFATDELMNEDALQIKHKDKFTYLYKSKSKNSISFIDERHPGPHCLMLGSVNMEPVKLDSSSIKKIPAVADILYSTADGKLTLDEQTNNTNNTPIAICVIPEVLENFKECNDSDGAVRTARFVSLNYMSCETPGTGSINGNYMVFGNYHHKYTIGNVKGGTEETSYIGGKWNTQQCLYKATAQDQHICDGIINSDARGACAPACCCAVYSTLGTKSGDWYLPMIGELLQIYENKKVINKKRTELVGSAFDFNTGCWSSREDSSYSEYTVKYENIYKTSKQEQRYVLAFLTLEY